MKRDKKKKCLYIVECWIYEDEYPDANVCHVASTLKKAKKWMKSHMDYGGTENSSDSYPWEFVVFKHKLDEDLCCTISPTCEKVCRKVGDYYIK